MFFLSKNVYLDFAYILYVNCFWLLVSLNSKIYLIYRYTKLTTVVSRLLLQFGFYFLAYFSYFSLFREGKQTGNQGWILIITYSSILCLKLITVYALRKYRFGGGNIRTLVILGGNQSVESLKALFQERGYLGYQYRGYFSKKDTGKENYLGTIMDSFEYVLKNKIDEMYCSVADFKKKELNQIIEFGDIHNIVVKLIPTNTGILTGGLEVEYYDYIPVISLKKLPFDDPIIKYTKRIFDILFSAIIIVFVLSWISVVLFVLVKLGSKGPLVFKQTRDGLNGEKFSCYKFRSMSVNEDADNIQATKGDLRVTRVGKFIRKTSIDELPQFINVFIGDMSVVGPRPHMVSHSKEFVQKVNTYLMRNLVKPGVTGLAQVRGFRGEIEQESDMENRVRLDVFYIKNWSFILDMKIIVQTMINAVRGEEKAY